MLRDTPVCPTGGGTGSQQTILHEEQWKMPALPALLLSIYIAVSLLTMAPLSFSQVNTLSAVRMVDYPSYSSLVLTVQLISPAYSCSLN
ncbi:hypothetical protein FQA47_022222 [Oryzias melastigma]|uniref:Uncharacterized protein n=1 Tax=Oryzias melastigma TaxID=30732 RepID=A0A834FR99_ORYME|nr:hypothetical protein FQA47_022222 [Oryzias melastigma]